MARDAAGTPEYETVYLILVSEREAGARDKHG